MNRGSAIDERSGWAGRGDAGRRREPEARSAVFLDKDDTLLRDVPYSVELERIEWAPDVVRSLGRLRDAGHGLVLVTNQSGVARGHFTEREVRRYLGALSSQLSAEGVPLSAVMYCPHHPQGTVGPYARECTCRKPNPGMLAYASALLGLDLASSWMVGDLLDDVEAGSLAGCRTALLSVHDDQVPEASGPRRPDVVVAGLAAAVDAIVAAGGAARATGGAA